MKIKSNPRSCARCRRPVKIGNDYVHASKWNHSAFYHWRCWLEQLTERDQTTARELVRER